MEQNTIMNNKQLGKNGRSNEYHLSSHYSASTPEHQFQASSLGIKKVVSISIHSSVAKTENSMYPGPAFMIVSSPDCKGVYN